MPKKRQKQRRRGHFCWACGRMRANEKFSGRGHSRHLCKDCARLGRKELDYRQAIRDLERLRAWDGHVRGPQRGQFRRYLEHDDQRVRTYAVEVEMAVAWAQAEHRLYRDLEDVLNDWAAEEGMGLLEVDWPQQCDRLPGDEIAF